MTHEQANMGLPRILTLPDELRAAVERARAAAPAARWVRAAQELSGRCRSMRRSGPSWSDWV